jgi:hypothetical protein
MPRRRWRMVLGLLVAGAMIGAGAILASLEVNRTQKKNARP